MAIADPEAHQLAVICAQVADAEHGSDVQVFDVGDLLGITEYFVVVSASNRRLVRTLAERIEEKVKAELGRSSLRSEGLSEQQWVLVDFGDVVLHVFLNEIREFYAIERLYADAPKVAWQSA
jgi:ribosome-associated protein